MCVQSISYMDMTNRNVHEYEIWIMSRFRLSLLKDADRLGDLEVN